MRPLIQLWLVLWVAYVGAGSAISLLGFRHIDLSFASFTHALLAPLVQSGAVLTVGALKRRELDRGAADRVKPGLDSAAITLVAAVVVALQVVWVTAGSSFGGFVDRLVLNWVLAIELFAVAVLMALLGRHRKVLMGTLTILAVALPATIAALGLAGVPWTELARLLHLPPLTPMVTFAALGVAFLGGLWRASGRLRRFSAAGRLAEGALCMGWIGGLLVLHIAHGGGQLGSFWTRLAGTTLVLCASLLLAALLQARCEEASTMPSGLKWIWWTSPATRFGLLTVLMASYLFSAWVASATVGLTPPLTGEWIARTAAIPAVQTAALIVFVKAPRASLL